MIRLIYLGPSLHLLLSFSSDVLSDFLDFIEEWNHVESSNIDAAEENPERGTAADDKNADVITAVPLTFSEFS
jgi:hypothetical protein